MGDNTNTPTDGQEPAPAATDIDNNNTNPAPADDFDLGVFRFDTLDEQQEQPAGGGEQQQEPAADDYVFDLGEDTGIPEPLHAPFAAAAKEAGLDGTAAAGFINHALSIVQEQERAANQEAGRALKQEWGNEYEARVDATRRFMQRMAASAGLTAEQMGVLMGPNGFRLMDAMRRSVGEPTRPVGGGTNAHVPTVQERIDAIYNDPAKYAALINPADPNWKAVNDEMNKLMGIS